MAAVTEIVMVRNCGTKRCIRVCWTLAGLLLKFAKVCQSQTRFLKDVKRNRVEANQIDYWSQLNYQATIKQGKLFELEHF